jgi:hypothetical protein
MHTKNSAKHKRRMARNVREETAESTETEPPGLGGESIAATESVDHLTEVLDDADQASRDAKKFCFCAGQEKFARMLALQQVPTWTSPRHVEIKKMAKTNLRASKQAA